MVRARTVPRRWISFVAMLAVAAGLFWLPSAQPAADAATKTPVMQKSRLSPAQIAGWFHANSPGGYKAAVPVEFLAAYFVFEGDAENVSGDIAFAQSVVETAWFAYGGQVPASHNNYGGIGATDDGATGAKFRSPRIGVRAQIQHLRAYADPTVTASNLAYPLESPRFHLVTPKGKAPYWEDFGNGNWATDKNYSAKVLNTYASMRAFANANPHLQGRWMFSDVDAGSTFEYDIIAIAIEDVTRGCGGDRYCPRRSVTREEMASFVVRAAKLKPVSGNRFSDVPNDSTHRASINALAAAGITKGCNPPANTRFCPKREVTREEMASFMVRALKLPQVSGNRFSDVPNNSTHRADINTLAVAGVTKGCNPPANTRFCPRREVTREEMAAFLNRAFLR